MAKNYIPKKSEIAHIAELLAKRWGLDFDEKVELHQQLREGSAAIRVVRGYISDGPGFVGDIYFIVFGGGPEYHIVIGNYRPGKGGEHSWDFYPSEMTKEGG